MLLRNMPAPSNSQARRIRDEVQTLLQVAAVQQAESSASRRRGAATKKRDELAQNEKDVSVHQQPPPRGKKTSLILNHPVGNQRRHDTTSMRIVAVGMGTQKSAVTAPTAVGHTQRRGPDGSGTAGPSGVQQGNPQHAAAQPVSTPTSIAKYNDETKPELWLVDFLLACQLGGARGDDRAIIQQLPLFLSDTTRRWLEELLVNQIHDWVDLVGVFEGNFKGTYVRPGNSWDLSKCKLKSGETL